ncbi:energy transducer TonB [Prosthecochloris sp. HL-130-GSB]|jgi:periplasmic protein TonB|nr:energy transducer TonB [Prosthecochloris sp. HL-130-GSB]
MRNKGITICSWVGALVLHAVGLFIEWPGPVQQSVASEVPLNVMLESYASSVCENTEQLDEQVEELEKPPLQPERKPEPKVVDKPARTPEPVPKSQPQPEPAPVAESTVQEEVVSRPSRSPAASASRNVDHLFAAIRAAIEKKKFYPSVSRRLHQEGTVVLSLSLHSDGSIVNLSVLRSSGFRVLDKAALKAIRDAEPLPSPGEYGRQSLALTIPLNYQLY